MEKTFRQCAIDYIKNRHLCKGYVDYIVSQLQKLEQIEKIVKQVESLHPEVAIGDREGIRLIKEVLEQE